MKNIIQQCNDKGKKITIAILMIALLVTGTFAYTLLFKDDNVAVKASETITEYKVADTSNIFNENPAIINVDATFEKIEYITPMKPVDIQVPAGKKYCVLTFDDGPGLNSTDRILNVLAKYNIKGTWFVLGSRVSAYPSQVRKIAAAGHEIGNHSYSHADLSTLSYSGYMSEINRTQALIKNVTGQTPYYLRPPYGSYTYDMANRCGMGIALWNVDSLDWSYRYAPSIYNQVMSTMNSTAVILFHDIYDFTAEAVEMIVPKLVEQGYTFITYSQYRALGA